MQLQDEIDVLKEDCEVEMTMVESDIRVAEEFYREITP
jgi:hypothetical protein